MTDHDKADVQDRLRVETALLWNLYVNLRNLGKYRKIASSNQVIQYLLAQAGLQSNEHDTKEPIVIVNKLDTISGLIDLDLRSRSDPRPLMHCSCQITRIYMRRSK